MRGYEEPQEVGEAMSEDADTQMFRSVIDYGRDALKAAMLINGGAAIALLAFIGTIWSSGSEPDTVQSLAQSLAMFSYGVMAGAVACAGAYFTQYIYQTTSANKNSNCYLKLGIGLHVATVALVVGSFVMFGWGICLSIQTMVTHLSSS